MRVVFDTVVIVRALINPSGRWARLLFDRADSYEIVVSPPIVRVIAEVIERPKVSALFRPVPGRDAISVLAMLAAAESIVIDEATIPRICRDPKDDKFLATAKAGNAQFIVTEDQDLLVLGEYESIRIITTLAFLQMLDQQRSVS